MEQQPQSTPAPTSQKRAFEDDVPVSTPKKDHVQPDPDTPLTVLSSVSTPSPLKRAAVQALDLPNGSNSTPGDVSMATSASSDAQHAKRRKLTDKEKEEKRLEKEAKDKARAEQKAQKEEEKRIKDEEKRKKNEEREEKKRAKELELQQKEEEKRKKEEEKLKKERNQLKLISFFNKKNPDAEGSKPTAVETHSNSTSNEISLASDTPVQGANSASVSPQKALKQRAQTDYERFFLPFQLPSHAIMAPHNRYIEDAEKMASARSRLDQLLSQEDVAMEPVTIGSIISQLPKYRRRGLQLCSIAEIVERVNSSSDHPIDLTQENVDKSEDPLVLLKRIPMKYLHFPEDVRPPYYGTYTRLHTAREERRLARNPFSRTLPQANYDYDSEAEWEEPEEGEDIDSDGEEDLDEDGDDDLEGFLDDEDDAQVKRRLISSDLQPVSTGICWEDPHGVSRLNDGSGAISTEFKEFRMGCLLEPYPRSIDPFSTAYWAPEPKSSVAASSSAMQPPRMPLTQRPMNSMLNTLNAATSTPVPNTGPKPAKPPKRMIPNDQLPDFKAEVEGSDLTKIALIEALKKKFPKLPKDAISNTLSAVAARVGPKEVEKRWVLL